MQTLDRKVLLSATTVDTSTEDPSAEETPTADPSAEETPTADPSADDTSTADPSADDTSTADPSTTTAMGTEAWIGDVQATVMVGETQIDGYVELLEGDFTGMTVSFSGVLSGPAVGVYPDGNFNAMFDGELSGLAVVYLHDSSGTVIDQYSFYI